MQETTPSLASDLVRGSLQGVANQVETLRDRRDVTIVDGVPVVSEVPPSAGESVAGAVADLFAGQDVNDNVLVRVYTLPKHTPLTLMVLQ